MERSSDTPWLQCIIRESDAGGVGKHRTGIFLFSGRCSCSDSSDVSVLFGRCSPCGALCTVLCVVSLDSDTFGARSAANARLSSQALEAVGAWLEDDSMRVTVAGCLSCPAMGAGSAVELEVTAMMGISNVCSALPEKSSTCVTAPCSD
jgi:hypothetical protein